MMAKKITRIYQLKVTLKGIRPPIWRCIQVKGNITLLQLHDILQVVMGWYDYHLHMFTIREKFYGDPIYDEYDGFVTLDECDYRLEKVISTEGQRFLYQYDFGDSWDHEILVEEILEIEKGAHYPRCIQGKRARPPEDVGGIWGYQDFLEAIRNPDHEEHDQYLVWVGGEFDPEAFDLEAVNDELRKLKLRRTRDDETWEMGERKVEGDRSEKVLDWMGSLTSEQTAFAEKLPLRRDMVALLTYLQDNKVTGTSSTGNFPLKAVAEIGARFVKPISLETKIGDRVFKVRSESEVWPLYFRHVLAAAPGLISGSPGRRWKVLPGGEGFLALPSVMQVFNLIASWWTQINWAIAFPYELRSDDLGLDFRMTVLDRLLDLPQDKNTDFITFSDWVIQDTRLVWPIEDQERAQIVLRSIIERIVVNPHIDFGVLQATYQPNEILGGRHQRISSISITPFGKNLLTFLKKFTFSATSNA